MSNQATASALSVLLTKVAILENKIVHFDSWF